MSTPLATGRPLELMERVSGPYRGFHVAAYVVEFGGSFFGFAKIYLGQPQDVWTCAPFDKVASLACTSPEAALHFAEQRARELVRALTGDGETSAGPDAADAARQNWIMRALALLPASAAGWFKAACVAVLLLAAFAMLVGMGCSSYARRVAAAATASASPLYQPARFVDGLLCTGRHACTSAVLVEGVLDTHSIGRLQERARMAAPATLIVCFNSPGGTYEASSLAGGLPSNLHTCVADLVESEGALPTHALCASACAWAWMAGSQRVIYGSNSVGFHAPYEYDAPGCVPGNRFKGLLSAAAGWWSDRADHRYDDILRSARNELRIASLTRGPTEVFPLVAGRARALGLQTRESDAMFYVASRPQAVTAK